MQVACSIVLAAGGSTRLGGGQAKQLLHFEGQTLVRRAAETALAAGVGRVVVVVLGHRAEECEAGLVGLPVRTVRAANWAAGMGASLKAGLNAVLEVEPGASAVVVSLCDQPLIAPVDLRHLLSAGEVMRVGGAAPAIVASEYHGSLGVPALFTRETFAEIAALDDAAGAKVVIARQAGMGRVGRVSLPEAGFDVDTVEDYRRLTGA